MSEKRKRSKNAKPNKPHGRGNKFSNDERDRATTESGRRGNRENEFINGTAGSNDPSWWNRGGQLSKDSASFSFAQATGAPTRGFELGKQHFTAAGVMVLDYVPTFGTIRSSADPVNIAARLLYDTVNSKNSRTPTYDPSDLLVYTTAIANAWACHAWVRRVVGTYNTFDPNNRYWSKAVRMAMGCAPDSSDQLLVRWREVANWMAVRLNVFNVPAGIPYYQREIFMNNAIYMDDANRKASYFLFNPRALFKLVDNDPEHPARIGGLSYSKFPSETPGGITPDIIWSYFEDLVAPLFNDSVVPTISSDVEKAFGLANCFRLPMIDDSEVTIPVYNREVLMQINNARFYPSGDVDMLLSQYAVRQDPESNTLRANLMFFGSDPFAHAYITQKGLGIPVNFPMDSPSVDDTLEATRLMWALDPTSNKGHILTCSTEILVGSIIFKYEDVVRDGGTVWEVSTLTNPHELMSTVSSPVDTETIEKLRSYEQFGWAPILQWYFKPEATADASRSYCMSDVYNYSTIVAEDLKVLNDSAWLSILGAV